MSEYEQRLLFLQMFNYDADSGIVTYKVGRHKGRKGGEAGYLRQYDQRRIITIGGVKHFAHRVIWLMVNGAWPKGVIDHINGNPNDNRFVNLRDVNQSVNMQNQHRPHASSKTGILGVSKHKGKFRAMIHKGGKQTYIGSYASADDAKQAYINAKKNMHEGFTK